MSTARTVVKNAGASLLYRISTPLSSFVLVFFIARFLGASGLGKYSSALSLLFIFQAVASLGFPYLITREVAQDKSKAGKFFINASFLGLLFSILAAVLMCLVVNFISDAADVIHAGLILSISLLPYVLSIVCQSLSRGFERLEHIAIAVVAGDAFKIVFGVLALYKGYGLVYLIIVIAISHFVVFLISLYLTVKCFSMHFYKLSEIDFGFCKWVMRAAPIFNLILILGTIRMNIDVLILNKMMGEVEVGIYSAAYKLLTIGTLGISVYILGVQPVVFRLFKSSAREFEILCKESSRYFFIVFLPVIAGTMILSNRFILLIYKAEFLNSAYVLDIIVWVLILTAFNQMFANALVASNRQAINLQGNIISTVSNICLNLLLIPKMGAIGAAIASVVSTLAIFAYQYLFISKYMFKIDYLDQAKKPLLASVIMGMVIFLVRDINLFILILIGLGTYLFSLLVLKEFSARDVEVFKELLTGDKYGADN